MHRRRGQVDGEHAFVVDEEQRDELAHDTGPSICLDNSYYETEISSVPKLLRRSADYIELLGGVQVDDIMFEIDEHFKPSVPYLTICYHRPNSGHETASTDGHTGATRCSASRTDPPPSCNQGREERAWLSEQAEDPPRNGRRHRRTRRGRDSRPLFLHEEPTDCKWIPEHVSFVNVNYSRPEAHGGDGREAALDEVLSQLSARHQYVGEDIDPNMLRDGDNHSLRLHNPPAEPGLCSVSKLLRRTADAVDAMKKVEIDGLVLHTEVTALGRLPVVAVYYSRPTRADKDNRKEWVFIARDAKRRAKTMKKRRKRTKKRERRA